MNLSLSFRQHLPPYVLDELERLVAAIRSWGRTVESQGAALRTQYNKTNAALSPVPTFTADVVAGRSYTFEASLFLSADATGGTAFSIAGTCTARLIRYFVFVVNESGNTIESAITVKTLNNVPAGTAGLTLGLCRISGWIEVNTDGTLRLDFAQKTASGTSSLLIGSVLTVREV